MQGWSLVAPSIAPDAQISLLLMPPETLDRAEPAAIFANHCARLGRFYFLIGASLQELPDPEAARIARRTLRRQCVVRADDLVAIGHICFRPEEQRAVILQPIEIAPRLAA